MFRWKGKPSHRGLQNSSNQMGVVTTRKSKPNRKKDEYKDSYEGPRLRILVLVTEIRKSQRFRLKHRNPPAENASYFIRGEVFTQLLIPRTFDMVVELYKDEIRRWILHHFPDLKDNQKQLVELERFVWTLTHEIWHILELNGDLEIVFKGGFEI